MIQQEFYNTIDFNNKTRERHVFQAHQGDTSRGLWIDITVNGAKETNLSGHYIELYAEKPDGHAVGPLYSEIVNGRFFIDVNHHVFTAYGDVICEIWLINEIDDKRLGYRSFKYVVERSVREEGLISESERPTIDGLITLIQESLPALNDFIPRVEALDLELLENIGADFGALSEDVHGNAEDLIVLNDYHSKTLTKEHMLRRLPNGVRDTLEKTGDNFSITKNTFTFDLTPSLEWEDHTSTATHISFMLYKQAPQGIVDFIVDENVSVSNVMGDILPIREWGGSSGTANIRGLWLNGMTGIGISLPKSELSSATMAGFKEWLITNKPALLCELKVPAIKTIGRLNPTDISILELIKKMEVVGEESGFSDLMQELSDIRIDVDAKEIVIVQLREDMDALEPRVEALEGRLDILDGDGMDALQGNLGEEHILNKLPNGTEDELIRVDGKAQIKRKTFKRAFTIYDSWTDHSESETAISLYTEGSPTERVEYPNDGTGLLSNLPMREWSSATTIETRGIWFNGSSSTGISIPKEELETPNRAGFMKWLETYKPYVIYQLREPEIDSLEDLNINSTEIINLKARVNELDKIIDAILTGGN